MNKRVAEPSLSVLFCGRCEVLGRRLLPSQGMDPGIEPCSLSLMYLKSAFLAMEPADCLISLARQSGGGSITTGVQSFILEHCVNKVAGRGTVWNNKYIKNTLKKVIASAESSCDDVVEGLYEQFAYHMSLHTEDDLIKKNSRICKHISFLFPGQDNSSSAPMNLVVPLQCSLNMLEGDTGCAIWPSSLFLSEFILSCPKIFSNKFCFEVGSGAGLVGITLTNAGASKVVLTDGDMSSFANMKLNLELNQLNIESKFSERTSPKLVECKYLQWESAFESELQNYQPDIVLGADIIYDPLCMPHLIRILSILLKPGRASSSERETNDTNGCEFTHQRKESNHDISQNKAKEAPVAYMATVVRNSKTFDYFLRLAGESHLSVSDITEVSKPLNLLPYMLSYDRSNVRLYKVSFSCI